MYMGSYISFDEHIEVYAYIHKYIYICKHIHMNVYIYIYICIYIYGMYIIGLINVYISLATGIHKHIRMNMTSFLRFI
jgi:hypothetical protein